jgi:hypothetical protein
MVHPDRDRRRLATPGERADGDPVRLLEGLGEHAIPTVPGLPGTQVVRVLEVDRVDRALWNERIDDERRRGCLLERLQFFRLEAHVLVLGDLVPLHSLFARNDPVDGALQAHLDAGAALRVQEMEGDALRARGGEELDGNHGQAEGDVEVL